MGLGNAPPRLWQPHRDWQAQASQSPSSPQLRLSSLRPGTRYVDSESRRLAGNDQDSSTRTRMQARSGVRAG
eukprot:1374995-Rhodomonas_salina.1